ncbi:MAG: TonB-dependent receptor, partial [Proteobacteria bacterium]|nr:TonB-dependent receptor [Pseudomonadota bacterium]
PDSVSGFRVITSNPGAEYGRSSGAQVILETNSGSNAFHGKLFWFYQTPGLNANDPGNIENGLPRPQFVQHIPGFSLGGPIFKNKTFFFVNTQFLHASQGIFVNSLVYTSLARTGIFRYVTACPAAIAPSDCHNTQAGVDTSTVDATGNVLPGFTVAAYDIVTNDPAGRGLDPSIQSFIGLTPLPNNFNIGDGLNTAGFSFLAPQQERQVDFTVRIDHQFNAKNSIFGRWSHGHQNTLGDIVNGGSPPFPNAPNVVDTQRQPRNLAISWRYTPNSTITNEAIVGMNRFIFNFVNPDPNFASNPPFVLNGDVNSGLALTSPLQNYVGNLRRLTTLQFVDNLTYIRGPHAFKFGTNLRLQRHIDDRGSIGNDDASAVVNFDTTINRVNSCSPAPSPGCFNLPNNIEQNFDLPTLQGSINNLLGKVGAISQGLVAQSPSQYAAAGTHLIEDFKLPEYDFYAQDSWKIRRNLVIDLGLRWEIKLAPRTGPNFNLHPDQPFTIGSPASNNLTWVPGSLYKDSLRGLSPSIGFAWDPFNNGKSSIRANYRLAYDRINTFVLSSAIFQGIPGETFQGLNTIFGQGGGRVSDGLPVIDSGGQTPLSARQPAPFSQNGITVIDPNWRPPQVHEWSLSVQRQVGNNAVFELAYIGHKAVHLFGGYDANQVELRKNGFLDAFNTVRAGNDSPLIDQLLSGDPGRASVGESGSDYLRDSANGSPYATDLSRGSVASVAGTIATTVSTDGTSSLPVFAGLSPNFFQAYPQYAGGFDVLDSNDWSTYHALQATFHGKFHDLTYQTNYTWSKSMDTRSFDPTFSTIVGGRSPFGSSSTPFDNFDRRRNYAPSDFDRTHVFQSIWTYQIPFGKDRTWGSNWGPVLDRLVGGWELSGIYLLESGHPTTVYSQVHTTSNVVYSPASCNGCTHDMFNVHHDASGSLNYLTPAQMALFFNPAPGEFSNLGRNFFRLAHYAVTNLSIGKVTKLKWDHTLELRVEMQNAFNNVHYDEPARARIGNSEFGVLDAINVENHVSAGSFPRTIQLSAKYTF